MQKKNALSLLEADAHHFQQSLQEWVREEFGEDLERVGSKRPEVINLKKAFRSCCLYFEDQELDPEFDRAKLISILACGLAAFSGLSPTRCRRLVKKVNRKAKQTVKELGEPEFAGQDLNLDQALDLVSNRTRQ